MTRTSPTSIVIFGGRSYTAGEFLRLMTGHPGLRLAAVVSRTASGASLDELQPHVAGCFGDLKATDDEGAYALLREQPTAAAILCVGSGEAAEIVAALADKGLLERRVVIDLSGDFRLADAELYRRWYDKSHAAPEWLSRFDYCVPELHRTRCRSPLVSNPGCFATAVQFACAPALRGKLIEPDLRVFAVTGSSGSGATPKPNTHHPFRAHEFYAYRPLAHQHTPEIRRGLDLDAETELSLVTHSAPLVRGISVTAMFRLCRESDASAFVAAYRDFAASEPMLRYVDSPPLLAGVIGTNLVRMSACVEGRKAAAFCCIDNLTRGASGQAMQNLNRVLGFPESTALQYPGLNPF